MIGAMRLDASSALGNPEYSLNTAGYAACDTTNRPTDGPTNRPGRMTADSSALLCPTHDSLRLDGNRHDENGETDCGQEYRSFHRSCSSLRRIQTRCAGEVPCRAQMLA
jgi:hypothetical protein